MTDSIYEPLAREEVIKAVERKGPSRVPMISSQWWGEGLGEQYGERLAEFNRYPNDAAMLLINAMPVDVEQLSWRRDDSAGKGYDSGGLLPDWKHLDEFLEHIPDPEAPELLGNLKESVAQQREADRYVLFGWWGFFFERPWGLRGMENLLMDYFLYPEEIHRLHEAMCAYYVGVIRRAGRELGPDGFWTSDDLGTQRQLMMMPGQFREFLKPYYRRVADACKEAGMHFWLHSCGNNTDVMDDLIEVGLDVFHPVQKHTMDEVATAERFGERLTFLVGFDVQHILQEATPDGVRAEVRHLIDTFDRPEGGMCLAAGNGIVGGTPIENIDAFLDEGVRYGAAHRRSFGA